MKKAFTFGVVLLVIATMMVTQYPIARAQAKTTITITLVNNPDQRKLIELASNFTSAYPNIDLSFVTLPENELRDRLTTDISTGTGSFDIAQIGTYDTPIFAKNGQLAALDDLMTANPKSVQPNYNVDDIIKAIRLGLSYNGKLYAVPFYGESSMTFYNKKMFADAGLKMPDEPTWDQIHDFACKLHNPAKKQYGIALRGLPGWGELLAPLDTVINTYGGKWFDANWQPQLNSKEFHDAVSFYVDLLQKCGVPGAATNGFSESLTLMAQGQAAMWVDATVAAGFLPDPNKSKIRNYVGFVMAPYGPLKKG